jgi:hypothetical protein
VGVPVSLGDAPTPGSTVEATFYVIDCPSYHFILGLTLLGAVNGMVDCGGRRLEYTLGPDGGGKRKALQCIDRQEVKEKPAYMAVQARV